MRLPPLLFVLASAACSAFAWGRDLHVAYPPYETVADTRFDDLIEILRSALEKTVPEFGPYDLAPSTQQMTEARYMSELQKGQSVNIVWSSTSEEKERDFLPLRIPLNKGILGYRIALIAKDKQDALARVQTLADLRRLSIGQGIGWGDVKLYEASGIKVTQAKYDNLFRMTSQGRFDLFPRGIAEVFHEYDLHVKVDPNLAIEKNLLLYYPWPYYFFFNKHDQALYKRIDTGIRMMIKDGSFDALFRKYNGKAIAQAKLKERRVIRIPNPMLPKETPLSDPTLWFDPQRDAP
jgi:hypothetical protein